MILDLRISVRALLELRELGPPPRLSAQAGDGVFGPRFDRRLASFYGIIGSPRIHRVPTVLATSSGLGPPFLTSQPTRLISIRNKVASLTAALL